MSTIHYHPLHPSHFTPLLELANQVHGDNYMALDELETIYQKSFKNQINASWVAMDEGKLVGFRLTLAAGSWQADKWCSPELWPHDISQIYYFKCNTVNENYRGYGIGSALLKRSVAQAAKQGSLAGLAHIWLASPGNSAYKYFSKCGGKMVKEHPGKWNDHCLYDNYICPVCGSPCDCVGGEMLLDFANTLHV